MNDEIKSGFVLTKVQLSSAICFFGIFITGSIIRYGIYNIAYLQKYSPLMILGFILVCSYSRGGKRDLSSRRFDRRILLSYVLLVIYCFTLSFWQGEVRGYLQNNIFLAASTLITIFRFRDSDEFIDILKLWTSFLKLCVVIMICGELIDVTCNMAVTRFFADFSKLPSLSRMYRQGRSVTYMGHSLFSAEIFLVYYCFDYILCMVNGTKQKKWAFILPMVGVALNQARATFILFLLLFVILNLQNGRIKNIILFALLAILVYEMGFLDRIIDRFIFGFMSGDISSGRNTSIQLLMQTGELNLKWFSGHTGYDESAALLNMALEYPILAWSYSYGIVGALLFVVLLFVYPAITMLRRKQKELFVIGMAVMLCVNSYAGLSTSGIQPFIYYITICMILNTSNYFETMRKAELC